MKRKVASFALLGALVVGAVIGTLANEDGLPLIKLTPAQAIEQPALSELTTAPGFRATLYADDVPNARFMRLTSRGDLLVSSPKKKRVYLLRDRDGNGRAEPARKLISGLNAPHGLDIHDGWLYIAETDAVGRIRFDENSGETSGDYQRIIKDLPTGGHYTRTLRFRDGLMYLSIGASCNRCEEEDPRRAAILTYQPDGTGQKILASGLRNSVGFDWAPWNGALYATDNGRDMLGDDFPPDELNRIVVGGFYGWPYINGFSVLDPDLGEGKEALLKTSIEPEYGFRAHNAPLGIRFNQHDNLPVHFAKSALVALHGSWNRSKKDGYKVISLHWDSEGKITTNDFLSGFLKSDEKVIGRPVDIIQNTAGEFLISDDYAGAIYRVRFIGEGG